MHPGCFRTEGISGVTASPKCFCDGVSLCFTTVFSRKTTPCDLFPYSDTHYGSNATFLWAVKKQKNRDT